MDVVLDSKVRQELWVPSKLMDVVQASRGRQEHWVASRFNTRPIRSSMVLELLSYF